MLSRKYPRLWAGVLILTSAILIFALARNLLALGLFGLDIVLVIGTWQLARRQKMTTRWGLIWIGVLIVVLGIAKLPALQTVLGVGQWIGISYLIFRLIHMSIDARHERLGDGSLPETLIYALNPATMISGPIDRVQHNVSEQHCPPDWPRYTNDGAWRLFIGIFKKLALANLCYVVVAAHDMTQNPNQPVQVAWLWLIAYSFYLYFDFAAYSDLAIGVGRLMGLRLPENFANPYMQPTIARFWQAWHITLSNWLRDYIFFPLSRGLLKRFGSRFSTPILFISHMATMIACGLWHGLTSGFVMWGVWHGAGLFAYSQVPALRRRYGLPVLPTWLSIGMTYSFVTLGWVLFATDVPTALRILARLFLIK